MAEQKEERLTNVALHKLPRLVKGDPESRVMRFRTVEKFESPEHLYAACVEYFEWAENNPIRQRRKVPISLGANMGTGFEEVEDEFVRPFTLGALCLYIGVSGNTWYFWKDEKAYLYWPDAVPVIEWAESVIWDQKYTGAATNIFNSNFIARDLGLAEKSEVNQKVEETTKKEYDLTGFSRQEKMVFRALLQKALPSSEEGEE